MGASDIPFHRAHRPLGRQRRQPLVRIEEPELRHLRPHVESYPHAQTPTAPSRRLFFEVPHNLGPRETATKMRHAPTGLAGDRISFELGVPTLQSTHNTLSKTIRAQSIELLNKHLATATDRHAQVKRAHCGPMRTKYHRDARAVRQCL